MTTPTPPITPTLRRVLRSGLTLLDHQPIAHRSSGDRSDTERSHEDLHFSRDSSIGNGLFWKRADANDWLNQSDNMNPGYRRNDSYAMGSALRGLTDTAGGWLTGMADKGPIGGAIGYGLPAAALGGLGGLAYDAFLRSPDERPKTGLSTVLSAAIGAALGGASGYARRQSLEDEQAARELIMANYQRMKHNLANGIHETNITP